MTDATPARDRRPARHRRAAYAILQNGFRPFFLGGALYAALALWLWMAMLTGGLVLPAAFDPLAWHQHEMLFGYVAAVVAGFVLTAVPNWTGRLPIRGVPLAMLFGLWLAGRIAVACSAWLGAPLAALVDVAFLACMSGLVLREIAAGRNWRNLPVATALALLALANALAHLEPAAGLATGSIGHRLGIAVVLTLIGLIGGRVVPSFTRNWLAKRDAAPPAPFGTPDKVALLALVIALLAWVIRPDAAVAGWLLVLAGVVHAVRLARWRGWRTTAEPLVLILHVGYAWLPLGLLLLGAQIALPGLGQLAALHALTAGAFGTMTLAIMTRASLGHTGRPLTAGGWTVAIYLAVVAGALLRVLSPLFQDYRAALIAAAILWSGAFVLFAVVYGPMLSGRRARSTSPA